MRSLPEAEVQSIISLAQTLRPWSAEFKASAAHAIAGHAAASARPDIEAIDLLLAAYLRAYSARFGKQAAAELGKLMKDIRRANECANGNNGIAPKKVGRRTSKMKGAGA